MPSAAKFLSEVFIIHAVLRGRCNGLVLLIELCNSSCGCARARALPRCNYTREAAERALLIINEDIILKRASDNVTAM